MKKAHTIKHVRTDSLRPDPDQPRQSFDKETLKELAVTARSVGIVNPVEIDSTGQIITGERRWRAAMLAGLVEISVVEIEGITDGERLLRQIVENLQYEQPSSWDIGKALARLQHTTKATTPQISQMVGKSRQWVDERLEGAQEPRWETARENEVDISAVRSANTAPEPFRETLKDLVIDKKLSRTGVQAVTDALTRKPEKAKELMGLNFGELNTEAVLTKVREIAPSPWQEQDRGSVEWEKRKRERDRIEKQDRILQYAKWLQGALTETPQNAISENRRILFVNALQSIQVEIEDWLRKGNEYNGQEIIEGKTLLEG